MTGGNENVGFGICDSRSLLRAARDADPSVQGVYKVGDAKIATLSLPAYLRAPERRWRRIAIASVCLNAFLLGLVAAAML